MQHTVGSDAPALALDDIFHTMSPSPTPQPLPPEPSTSTLPEHHFSFDANPPHSVPITEYSTHIPRTHSPEPLDYSELEAMRARVQECAPSHSAREAEFAAMVLRLASHLLLHPSPAQLASQAEVIADLTFQRNLLLRERAEEHDRWQSERDQWDRTADALARKARAVYEPARADSETQRHVARLEDDLKITRRKLAETQSRFSSLERELSRLRPLLSLHATILRDSQLWEPIQYPAIVVEPHARGSHEVGRAAHEGNTTTETRVESQGDDGVHQSHSTQAPRVPSSKHHSRKGRDRDRERPRKHRHRHSIAASRPLLADARSEFILVAARKLGRLRAGVLSGFVKERAKLDREGELLLATNTHVDRNSRHDPPSPSGSRPRPSVLDGTAGSDYRTAVEGDAGSSSPPVPLAASRQRRGSSSKTTQRRLAPSPFAPGAGGAVARPPNMPTHLHPSAQAYPVATQGRHPQAMPHPGFVYFAPGPGQSGTMPFVVPVPWTLPGTPPGNRQTQGQAAPALVPPSKLKTPARAQAAGTAEGSSTPMDSLVSAARTLIEDEDYDGDEGEAGGSGAAPATETEATAEEEDVVPEETPLRRRGTRRRAAAAAPDSPAPKRRRTAGTASHELTAPSAAGPSAKKATRKAKAAAAAAAASQVQEKPKSRGRAKGKGKQKSDTPPPDRLSPSPASPSAPAPTASARVPHAPQVARIRSALDVLADQAAQEQGRWPSLDAASRRDSESEGREEDAVPEAARTPTPPAPEPVVDDVFAPEPSSGGERESTVESPKMDTDVQDAAPAAQEDADVKDANIGGEAAHVGTVEVPEAAASRIFDEDPAHAPDATPQRPPTPSSPPIASLPPPPSSPTPPEHPRLSPPRPSHSPPPEAPVLEPQGPFTSHSPSPTSAPAVDPAPSAEAPVDSPDADVSDVPPPPPGFGDEAGGAPGVLEIESSDEDAEGSIVDFEID